MSVATLAKDPPFFFLDMSAATFIMVIWLAEGGKNMLVFALLKDKGDYIMCGPKIDLCVQAMMRIFISKMVTPWLLNTEN